MGLGLERVETDSHVRKKADLLSKLRINITQLIQSTLSLSRCNHRHTHRHLYTLKPKHVIKLNLETLTFNVKETFCVLQVRLCDCVTVAPLCCHRPQMHFKVFGFKSSLAKQFSSVTSRHRFSIKETAYDGWLKVCWDYFWNVPFSPFKCFLLALQRWIYIARMCETLRS